MSRSWLVPARRAPQRAVEATPQQIAATGASGTWMGDPIDSDGPWRKLGRFNREIPWYTREKAMTMSVAAYRINPMARAIIDTYTSFCVGDKGVRLEVTNPRVAEVAHEFWNDPRNNVAAGQQLGLRSCMLLGETVRELMVGPVSGVVRYAPIDASRVVDVRSTFGHAAWSDELVVRDEGDERTLRIAGIDDITRLRDGQVLHWTPWKSLETDTRSQPFLGPVLDWLANYDTVLSNLIDRTALARYLVWDVTVEGGQAEVDAYVNARGGMHAPRSGAVEVHNQSVTWSAKNADTGAYEDKSAAGSVLTLIAGGAGLAKTWLAEPEDANRATSLTMAEPVRRRVQGVQQVWLEYQAEMTKLAVDRAVAAKRLPALVDATDPTNRVTALLPAAETVRVTGPEIAAADAEVTAKVLLNLATGLEKMVAAGVLSPEARQLAGQKAWEDYMGVPWRAELGTPDANPDDVAAEVDAAAKKPPLRAV